MLLDKLIVMCDVSGLADKSDKFANFLTVSCKYGITCVYMSHTIYPTRHNWQMMMPQTKILIFFPGSVQAGSIHRIRNLLLPTDIKTLIHHTEIFGLINYILKCLILKKNNALLLILVT